MSKKSELSQFERDLLESFRQARAGEYAAVHTPEQIEARRRPVGRPAGSTKANPKVSINLRIDPDALASWRASGKGWQTRAASVLAVHAPV